MGVTQGGKPIVAQMNTGQAAKPKPAIDPTKKGRAVTAAPFRIQYLGDKHKYLKMLIYGPHGSGKTTLAASAVDVESMRNILLVNAESGDMSVSDSPYVQHPEFILDTGPIIDFYQAANVLQNFLRPHCRFRDAGDTDSLKKLQAKYFGQNESEIDEPIIFKTVIVDSIREIEVYCIYKLLGIDINDPDYELDADDMSVPEWAEYKKNNQMTQMLLRGYRDLPMHVILSCPAKWSQDERKVYHWVPYLTGQLQQQVQGFVDVVGYIVQGSDADGNRLTKTYLQPGNVTGIGKFDAKNRKASMPEAYIDNLSMSMLMERLNLVK